MSIKASVSISGMKELDAALKELGSEVAGQKGGPVKTALMGAALPVLKDAQARVPKDDGDLKKAIKRKRERNPRKYSEIIYVQVPLPEWDSGNKRVITNKKQGGHGLFVEMGTSLPRKRGERRPFSGDFQRAQPFLRPALESNREKSVAIFRTKLAAGIERLAKKIGAKNIASVGARIKKL